MMMMNDDYDYDVFVTIKLFNKEEKKFHFILVFILSIYKNII
jgi:hypothetical protein